MATASPRTTAAFTSSREFRGRPVTADDTLEAINRKAGSSSTDSRTCHHEQLAQRMVNVQGGARPTSLQPRTTETGSMETAKASDLLTPRVYRGRYHYGMDTPRQRIRSLRVFRGRYRYGRDRS